MTTNVREMPELPPDVLQLVFQQLVGDNEALLNISLTCSAWRSLARPSVYRVVDISSHNNGRQFQLECEMRPLVYADYDGEYRPRNLVSRQRAFLRLMVNEPQLARYVRSFTWTLIWLDFDEVDLIDIDLQTWSVFGRMTNVTCLDLASLHRNEDDEYIRENPAALFPKVTDLRLLGWMHRGLVRSILKSLDPGKLQSLRLDYLEDEGAFPNGESLGEHTATRLAHHAKRMDTSHDPHPKTTDGSNIYHDDLILRQETGKAFVFPGPMWLPLHLLSTHGMESLSRLHVKVRPFDMYTDLRSYQTLFQQTASFAAKVRNTLRSLVIVFGEPNGLWEPCHPELCGTAYVRRVSATVHGVSRWRSSSSIKCSQHSMIMHFHCWRRSVSKGLPFLKGQIHAKLQTPSSPVPSRWSKTADSPKEVLLTSRAYRVGRATMDTIVLRMAIAGLRSSWLEAEWWKH